MTLVMHTPWSYALIRLLFRFVLKIFYGSIVIENPQNVPPTGVPCIVCANHSNSLTDALMLVTSMPPQRNMLRLTAKATQFGHRTFTSWLIESAGTVPIKRRKDYDESTTVDNSDVMEKLHQALEEGDAVCLFPEGMSRYHPTIAPLRTGVARMVSDVLSRNKDDPDFQVAVLPCSVTYMHRQHFRSDVLVTYHPPMVFTPRTHPDLVNPTDFSHIRDLTSRLHEEIASGTYDSPSWDLIRSAKLAARIYAPLGTLMTLGDFVRTSRAFLELFKAHQVKTPENEKGFDEISKLEKDLKAYQDKLSLAGLKDDRIRRGPLPLPLPTHLLRILIRLTWSLSLLMLSLPGLLLWTPVFMTTFYAVHNFKKTGPVFDTWDEIAQYKLIYGLMSGILVWFLGVILTWPIAPVTVFLIPGIMWMTLRWLEDCVSSIRAFTALSRLLVLSLFRRKELKEMQQTRHDLHSRVLDVAVNKLGLAEDPEVHYARSGGKEKGRVREGWDSRRRYFSIKRRRKRDWNETLRLYDKVDYPDQDW